MPARAGAVDGEAETVVLQKTWLSMFAAAMTAMGSAATVLPMTTIDAVANSCKACRDQHNRCRIERKGHVSCDRQLENCLRRCLRGQ